MFTVGIVHQSTGIEHETSFKRLNFTHIQFWLYSTSSPPCSR